MARNACMLAEYESFSLNSDGTTKFRKKLGLAAIGMVLCLNEVSDGSTEYDLLELETFVILLML